MLIYKMVLLEVLNYEWLPFNVICFVYVFVSLLFSLNVHYYKYCRDHLHLIYMR